MKHLLDIKSLTADDITNLLDEAENFAGALIDREVKKLPTLRGFQICMLFYENSTRTSSSFELAGKMLSADMMKISASTSSVQKGESLRDTGLTLKALGAQGIIMRHPHPGAPHLLADWLSEDGECPSIINAGDGAHQHPTQALLDALTIRQKLGGFDGRKILLVGDCLHSRVVRSNVELLTTMGAEVVLVAPRTLVPSGVETWNVRVTQDFDKELKDADAVMMLRVQEERMQGGFFPSQREYNELYGMTKKRHSMMSDKAIVMHPGPMIRGKEIDYPVADASNSTVLHQVSNGVHIRMAVLYSTLLS